MIWVQRELQTQDAGFSVAGQIWLLVLFTWPSCLMSSCGWVVAAVIIIFYPTSSHCICNMLLEGGVSSMRPFICGMTRPLPSSLTNSRCMCFGQTTHVIRVLCSEVGVGIEGGNIQHIVPEHHGPPPCSPLTCVGANHLIHCVHS